MSSGGFDIGNIQTPGQKTVYDALLPGIQNLGNSLATGSPLYDIPDITSMMPTQGWYSGLDPNVKAGLWEPYREEEQRLMDRMNVSGQLGNTRAGFSGAAADALGEQMRKATGNVASQGWGMVSPALQAGWQSELSRNRDPYNIMSGLIGGTYGEPYITSEPSDYAGLAGGVGDVLGNILGNVGTNWLSKLLGLETNEGLLEGLTGSGGSLSSLLSGGTSLLGTGGMTEGATSLASLLGGGTGLPSLAAGIPEGLSLLGGGTGLPSLAAGIPEELSLLGGGMAAAGGTAAAAGGATGLGGAATLSPVAAGGTGAGGLGLLGILGPLAAFGIPAALIASHYGGADFPEGSYNTAHLAGMTEVYGKDVSKWESGKGIPSANYTVEQSDFAGIPEGYQILQKYSDARDEVVSEFNDQVLSALSQLSPEERSAAEQALSEIDFSYQPKTFPTNVINLEQDLTVFGKSQYFTNLLSKIRPEEELVINPINQKPMPVSQVLSQFSNLPPEAQQLLENIPRTKHFVTPEALKPLVDILFTNKEDMYKFINDRET